MSIFIQVVGDVDSDGLLAEIWIDDELFAEVKGKQNNRQIIVYQRLYDKTWSIGLSSLMSYIDEVSSRFLRLALFVYTNPLSILFLHIVHTQFRG